jgi:hypothetical protein
LYSIKRCGANNACLPATSYSYDTAHSGGQLMRVDNGSGGAAIFAYDFDHCSEGDPLRCPVVSDRRVAADGLYDPAVESRYAYPFA